MIRTPSIERATSRALLVACMVAACGGGGSKPAVTGPDHGPTLAAGSAGTASASAPAPATPSPGGEDAVLPLWPEIKHGTLPNGLTYYILKHQKPEHRAFLWLAVNAGSVLEEDDQRGLAHFDEHMAFNGTRRFPKAEIVNYLEKIGMRFGADLNARTEFDDTVYELEVPTDNQVFLAKGLDILHDWAGDVTYDPAEVDKERGVVKEEWRQGRGAGERIFDKQAPVLFKGSRYAVRLPIGLPQVIDKAPRDQLYRFYKDWYRPDLMAVIAVGDFDDAGAIEREIRARFADLKNPAHERPRGVAGVPRPDGTRVSIETDRELPWTEVSVYNLLPHRPEASYKDFRRLVVEQVYQSVLNERFATISRRPDAPFVGAGAGISSLTREIDGFVREARAKPGKVPATLESLFTEVLRVEQHGVTQGELDRARTILARNAEQNDAEDATSDSRNYTEEITRHFFEHELLIGRASEKELTLTYLPTITLAEINTLAKAFGGADNRVILVAGPDASKAPPLPTRDRVLAIIDEVGKRTIDPWEDKVVTAKLMAQLPRPGKIVQETKVPAINATEWTLSNGARVILKPTDFEADQVLLAGSSPGGLAMASDREFRDARFADDIAGVGGVGELDAEELQKVLAGKHVTASTAIGGTTESVEAGASARDLETMFQLVHLEMTAPRKDERAITVWRTNLIDQLENRLRVPEVKFAMESRAVLYKNHPREKSLEPGDVAKANADKALAFYKDRFGDASDVTFVIAGAFDPAQLRPLVETYLASLPGKGRKEKQKDLGIRKVSGIVKKIWHLGQEPKAHVQLMFHGDESWTRDKDRDMFILGDVLAIRLREVLREDKGGVYGVESSGFIARAPHQERSFTISFGCDPARVDELVKATFDEIAAIQRDGIAADTLEKVAQTFLRERELQLRSNGFWVGWLTSAYTFGDDPALVLDPSKMTARMTSDNVKAAAKRYLPSTQYFEAILLPAK
ncbi:MAG TPA: insulinase family protein [Kofleriaceae bacterium]|jgi:zinc protease|nr:insulinase family protein [Kofleriaceae bacterium]